MREAAAYLVQIAFLCRKELQALFKEKASRLILVAPALLQALLFGYAGTYNLTNVPYVVLDQSRGEAAKELLARLDGTGVFHRQATVTSPAQMAAAIDAGDVLLALNIPSDFETLLATGQPAPLQVILDGRNSTTAGFASAYIASVVGRYNADRVGALSRVQVDTRAWFNPNLESRWNLMVAMIAALSMLQTMLLAALSVAREREQGTFDQLLVTPLTPIQILVGKALPTIFVGLLQATIIFLIVRFWFGVPLHGSLALLYLGLIIFMSAAVGIGLSMSALSRNMQQAMLYTFMLVTPLMLLSGLLTPVRNMPEVLQVATYVNPLRFGMDITRRVYLEGAVFPDVAISFVPLLVVAAVTLPLAAWLFRNRLV